jgi:hypothetical protein
MTHPFLSIARLERRLAIGTTEALDFEAGVCLLVGRPNTGKTKWLQTLDFLFGDPGANPYEGEEETGLAEKYESASVALRIGENRFLVERRWREPGGKGKLYVDGLAMLPKDFQHWLLEQLGIPLLHYPKGNPMSGQTWPELSFRSLLRHIYRQQRFWGSLVDQQSDSEFLASLLQFLGLAEHIFTDDYGELVNLKLEVERLRARRDQYGQTLGELARDLLADDDITVDVNIATVAAAQARLMAQTSMLRGRRIELLTRSSEQVIAPGERSRIAELGEQRVAASTQLESLARKREALNERAQEIGLYRADLAEELERIARAEDAGAVLADLKVTHCPACDQTLAAWPVPAGDCLLCHQHLPAAPTIEGLGAVRLRFERDRLAGELKEADALSDVIARDIARHAEERAGAEERLQQIENELIPAREAVAAIAQSGISEIDMGLGQASERQRQLERVSGALELETGLTDRIQALEKQIAPIQDRVDAAIQSIDFDAASGYLEDGMNAYLEALNHLRPNTWRHSPVRVDLSRRGATFRVGSRRWSTALGGTDSLYFLMAYHYGLLSVSPRPSCHYPGIAIIDLPGEFLGEAIEDKENFIVQPFVDLLDKDGFEGVQMVITGASFTGLAGAHVETLRHVHVA